MWTKVLALQKCMVYIGLFHPCEHRANISDKDQGIKLAFSIALADPTFLTTQRLSAFAQCPQLPESSRRSTGVKTDDLCVCVCVIPPPLLSCVFQSLCTPILTSLTAVESATQVNVMSHDCTTSAGLLPFSAPAFTNSRHWKKKTIWWLSKNKRQTEGNLYGYIIPP